MVNTGGLPAGGQAAGGGAGGGSSTGGAGAGGAEAGGSGGAGAGGGGAGGAPSGGGSSGTEADFVRCFPWGTSPPQGGPLLAATPTGSVLALGPSAPPELIPESPGRPFLVELSPAGAVLRTFAIPDAPGPEVLTVGDDGTILFAGQAGPGAIGELALPDVESGYYLAKLSPSFEVLAVTAANSPSTQVNALHVDSEGDILAGIAIADFAAGSMQPAVVEFAGDTLEEDWSVTFGHEIMPARAIRSSSSELPVSSGPFRVEKHAVSAPRRAVAAPR